MPSFHRSRDFPREEGQNMAGSRVELLKLSSPAPRAMSGAIGFVLIVIALGIFMPDVLHALSTLLLTLFQRATSFVQAVPMPAPQAYPAAGN